MHWEVRGGPKAAAETAAGQGGPLLLGLGDAAPVRERREDGGVAPALDDARVLLLHREGVRRALELLCVRRILQENVRLPQ